MKTAVLLAVLLGQAAGWSTFTATDGKVSVAAPCVLTIDTTPPPEQKPGDPKTTTYLYSCSTAAKDEFYFIAWVDYEAGFKLDVAGELKANRDNTLKAIAGATLLTSTNSNYQGRPSLDFTGNIQGKFLVSSRVLIAGSRPYQVAAMTPIDKDRSESIRRFLDSLSIKN